MTTDSHHIDTLVSAYDFELPPELIAQRPINSADRAQSRLLVYNAQTDSITHDVFYNIGSYLPKDSTLVFNQSKVFPSRLIGKKGSGGKAELFFLESTPNDLGLYSVLIRTTSKKQLGSHYFFADGFSVELCELGIDGTFKVRIKLPDSFSSLMDYLETHALIPIPPYIRKGESDEADRTDYQTIYSKNIGSVAAPTAGLHFTKDLLGNLKNSGVDDAYVTLHVGLGTFRPVSVSNIKDHVMHEESYFIDAENLSKIRSAKNIVAVGTTSLRVLESSIHEENFFADKFFQTSIFLHPGVEVTSINGLLTNFHLPKSSLLMLVSSLVGREKTLELYAEAIKEKYRFFSYGDAMLVIR